MSNVLSRNFHTQFPRYFRVREVDEMETRPHTVEKTRREQEIAFGNVDKKDAGGERRVAATGPEQIQILALPGSLYP